MTLTRDTAEYHSGMNVELHLETWLKTQSWVGTVARVRHGNTFAPVLETWYMAIDGSRVSEKRRMPDLQVYLRETGNYGWLEVKSKSTTGFYNVAGIRTTGIDSDCWNDYRAIQAATLHPVYVVFVHKAEDEIRVATLADPWRNGSGKGNVMKYVDYDRLPVWGHTSEMMSVRPSRPVIQAPLFVPEQTNIQRELF